MDENLKSTGGGFQAKGDGVFAINNVLQWPKMYMIDPEKVKTAEDAVYVFSLILQAMRITVPDNSPIFEQIKPYLEEEGK